MRLLVTAISKITKLLLKPYKMYSSSTCGLITITCKAMGEELVNSMKILEAWLCRISTLQVHIRSRKKWGQSHRLTNRRGMAKMNDRMSNRHGKIKPNPMEMEIKCESLRKGLCQTKKSCFNKPHLSTFSQMRIQSHSRARQWLSRVWVLVSFG